MKKNYNPLIAVCSRSVSKNKTAVQILKKKFKNIRLNDTDKILKDSGLISFIKDVSVATIGLEKIDENFKKKMKIFKIYLT